ncbi:hypothetical protein B0H11DRAFT_1914522 [Mycena galericulata]|nr:hypothetical protein B0H11DRAFT_1914522 [Mycena galericulata]
MYMTSIVHTCLTQYYTMVHRQQHIIKSVRKTSGKIASPAVGDENYAQARFSAKRANGLAKPTNGLASRNAGLGLGATPKSKPKPEKARLRGRKPVLQAENDTLPGDRTTEPNYMYPESSSATIPSRPNCLRFSVL